jgi:molybdopterin-guanine dinucleotide biosynthesis protein A
MGYDKALSGFLGAPLIQRVIRRVQSLADEILITTNHPESYRFLGVPLFADLVPGRGALGGLYTALSVASQPLTAVVACDMPFVSAALLAASRDLLIEGDYDAVIPRPKGGTEPFHAVYRCETCMLEIRRVLEAGKWRVDAWFRAVRIRFLTPDEIRLYDPLGMAFYNVNTPEELHRAEQLALQIEG